MHGLPPQPLSFFNKIYKYVIKKNSGFVVLASYEKKYIAGAVFFSFGNKALYKYGASDRGFQHLRANNIVMWKAIQWYCQNGYKYFYFGRTEPENNGLRQYKNGWGVNEYIIRYYRYDLRKDTFIKGKVKKAPSYTNYFKKIPIPFLRLIGSLLYKHIG